MRMRSTIFHLCSLLLAFSFGVFIHFVVMHQPKERNLSSFVEVPAQPHTIRWFVQQAQARGEQEVIVYPPVSCPVEFLEAENAVAEAASQMPVVVAQPLAKQSSMWGDYGVVTWYKFRIIENLNNENLTEGALHRDTPAELLPLRVGEFLLAIPGGVIEVNGVRVITVSRLNFSMSQQYLLFLMAANYNYPNPTGMTGVLPFGNRSVFTVNADGVIEPVFREPHPLQEGIESRYRNSLERLRAGLTRR